MNLSRIFLVLISVFMLNSCVSSKVHDELQEKYESSQSQNRKLSTELNETRAGYDNQLKDAKQEIDRLTSEKNKLQQDLAVETENFENLKRSYDALDANSSSALSENSQRNRQLLSELEGKEKSLKAEQERLEKMQKDLTARTKRVDELESLIAAKDAKMNALKLAVSNALTNFEGKGLTVEQRDGKVYVSMENKLLFSSGSWAVNNEGRKAVEQLGQVLAQNADIAVLIEGHTDNVPYGGKGMVEDNWDLSTKRATAIVHILNENKKIDPQNLTAAGRGEFSPIVKNDTAKGKAKNRRIEVILTPKLDEIAQMLNDID